MTHYTDGACEYFVSRGISRGTFWMTVRRKFEKEGTHRVKTKFLPIRTTKEAAQRDLDTWATKKGFVAYERTDNHERTEL